VLHLIRGSDRMSLHPPRDRLPDRRPGIFLDAMRTGDRHLGLVLPLPAELPDAPDQDRARFGVDEQFWQVQSECKIGANEPGPLAKAPCIQRSLLAPGLRHGYSPALTVYPQGRHARSFATDPQFGTICIYST